MRIEADVLADSSYCGYDYRLVDEGALRHVVAWAHDLDMRVLPYLSPTFSDVWAGISRDGCHC